MSVNDTHQDQKISLDTDNVIASSGLKHESAERIFRLVQFLLANECTRQEVFEHLASSYKFDRSAPVEKKTSRSADRMFERDLKFLEDQGFEVKKVKARAQPTRYSLVRGSGPRATFLFSESEVDSLALLYTLFADPNNYAQIDPLQPLPLQPPRNPFAEEMLSLIEKLVSTLPDQQRRHFERWVRKPYIYFNLATVADYLPHRDTIDTIVHVITKRQQIQFEYLSPKSTWDKVLHEHVDPYYVIYLEGHFYLIGYSHQTDKFLEYRIDRIKKESLKPEPDMIDMERRRRPIEFRFWLDGSIAKHGISQRWLTQTQEREEVYLDEQGRQRRRVLVRASAYNEWRVIQQLLRYGEKAELIDPPHLREEMRKAVNSMYKLYNSYPS
ncbi:MAG TPA: WYL domain-containing protein [Ktedonobacteraceae bacterium]|nr:WYL domain-containing protein [Ktedonobacteraceae bacterium]